MFFQPPDDEDNRKQYQVNPHRRKKHARKNKLKAIKKNLKRKQTNPFSTTMSAWAENFTKAATWQLEHQVAYWKSKAKALQYENRILHDMIRKNYLTEGCDVSSNVEQQDYEENSQENKSDSVEVNENDDFEISEEYLQFLMANAKFKEEARLERERLKAENDSDTNMIKEMEAGPSENKDDRQETLKTLYGDRWPRVSALETLLQSQFIDICDRDKPTHWPNIPFNFI